MTITELRIKKGLSQSQFARQVGIPLGTLQNWEQGKRTPPSYVLDLIEKVLKAEDEKPVTCKECSEWGINTGMQSMPGAKYCAVFRKYTGENFFCGDAERKDGE